MIPEDGEAELGTEGQRWPASPLPESPASGDCAEPLPEPAGPPRALFILRRSLEVITLLFTLTGFIYWELIVYRKEIVCKNADLYIFVTVSVAVARQTFIRLCHVVVRMCRGVKSVLYPT